MININLSTLPSDDEALIKEGFSLSGYKTIEEFAIEALINESKRLTQRAVNIELNNDDFDHFINVCKQGAEPNEKLRKAFKRLDDVSK
jgi:uncharacterized protein (DUF1778 family)